MVQRTVRGPKPTQAVPSGLLEPVKQKTTIAFLASRSLLLPVLLLLMMVSSGQGGGGLPAHEVLEPFDNDDPGYAAPRARPLEHAEQRDVRSRTTLFSDSNLTDLLDKVAGREALPAHVRKHVSSCVDTLTRKIEKSLKLLAKKRALIDQANALTDGKVPTGVKPFKVNVDVPELDLPIPEELSSLNIQFEPGCSFRDAKEKLHMASIALGKALDARVIEAQVANMKNELTCEAFVAACGKVKEERSSSAASMMAELGLSTAALPSPNLPKSKAIQLYASVIEKVATNRKIEEEKRSNNEETIAKKVERLRDTAPHKLLDAKIHQAVREALGKKQGSETKGKNLDSSIDYGAAYSMIVAERPDLLSEAIRPPPGLDTQGSVFRRARPKKPRDKGLGKGEGKTLSKGKGKGDGKTLGKGKGKEKRQGKTGGAPGGKGGGKNRNGKDKKGKGGGKPHWK